MANANHCRLAKALGWLLLTAIPPACGSGYAAPASSAPAAPPVVLATIAPGETRVFTVADGGRTACAGVLENPGHLPPAASTENECAISLIRYGSLFNAHDAIENQVWARAAQGPPPLSLLPSRAQSGVYNDFTVRDELTVDGWRSTMVDAQIAVTFDFAGTITGLSVYREQLSLSLVIEDVTVETHPVPVGTLELLTQGRDGDQGITDVSGTLERVTADDETNGLLVKLRRGSTYRVWLQLAATSFGSGWAEGSAQWSIVVVSIDEDTEVPDLGNAIESIRRLSIEEHLESGNALVSLYLPRERGGQLESVLDLVDSLIVASTEAGLAVGNAPYFMELARAESDGGSGRTAFGYASSAYRLMSQ